MAMKDVGLRIRVERELRSAFRSACAAENRDASEVLREFSADILRTASSRQTAQPLCPVWPGTGWVS